MKRSHKIKALALSMFAGLTVVAAPQVSADVIADEFVNTVEKSEAEIVLSLTASETELKPGDKFTLSFDLDKVPSNKLGVGGISFKLAYDGTKVTTEDETVPGYDIVLGPKVTKGPVATALGMGQPAYGTNGDLKTITIGMSASADSAYKETGNIFTVDFTVLDNVTPGEIEFQLLQNSPDPVDITKNIPGMAASGVLFNTEKLQFETDDSLPFYVESNLSELKATVEATSVKFDRISSVALDTVSKRSQALGSYLVIDPEGAKNNTVNWNSSNTSVATVDNQGTVTAVGNGTTTITATVDGKTASITVSVVVAPEKVEFVNLPDLNLDVTTEPTLSLKNSVKVSPSDAKVESLEWSSSDTSVATVDQNGNVTAVGNGSAEITVKYSDTLKATVTVNVTTTVSGVELSKSSIVLDMEEKLSDTFTYTLNPSTAVVKSVSAVSDDTEVATVTVDEATKTVTVNAVKYGTAKITLTVDGKTAVANVLVTVPLKSITLDKNTVEVYKGDEVKVTATASPEGSAWESLSAAVKSGSGVATTVDSSTGVVTLKGLERGNAVVSVYANNNQTGDFIKDVNVTIKENRVTAITLEADAKEVLRGENLKLKSSYSTEEPESVHKTTDDTTITWTSSDEKVATVDKEGNVTAIGEGTVVITAKMEGSANKVQATYELTVIEYPLTGIVIADEDKAVLESVVELTTEGGFVSVPFTVEPENCTDTAEEIIAKVTEGIEYDSELVKVEVAYDKETGKGTITVTSVAVGEGEVTIPLGYATEEGEEVETLVIKLSITEPVEEDVETGDISVVAMTLVMVISLGGIVISKRVLVK